VNGVSAKVRPPNPPFFARRYGDIVRDQLFDTRIARRCRCDSDSRSTIDRIVLGSTLLILSAAAAAPPAPVDPRVAAGFDAIDVRNLRADLTFIASDPLEGRMSLERGSEVAVQFIAAEFAKAGLTPVAPASYLQPVPLIEYLPDVQQTQLVLHRGGKEQRYDFLKHFVGFFPRDVATTAPVVFAGYGITAPQFNYDDYAGLDARGKIVLVFDHEPQENDPDSIFNGIGNTTAANTRLKVLNAQRHGAAGVLVVGEPDRKHPSNLERLARIPGIMDRFTRRPSQALLDNNGISIPYFTVDDDVGATLLAGAGKSPAELQAAIDRTLKPSPVVLRDTVVEMRVVNASMRRATTWNVIGFLEGSDPVLRNETVLFSGHFDHEGVWDGKIYHGADDNGSGTVGVIELARAFVRNPQKPKRSLAFVVFAAEERGLLGSYSYVAKPPRPLSGTRAVINFDMIGRNETPSPQTEGLTRISPDTSNELGLIGTINSPDYRAAVERANQQVGLSLTYKWDQDAALNIFQRSDQFPFAIRDIPAVWWFTGFHPDYHQPSDTVEKINFDKMQKILQLAYLTGWSFADAPAPPRYLRAPVPAKLSKQAR
jgi:Peptidase family M28/PA domain